MKRIRSWFTLLFVLAVLGGIGYLVLRTTEEYPTLGAAVSYPVNETDGFELTIIEKPSWSPWKGYTIQWRISAHSEDLYTFSWDPEIEPGFEYLERCVEGQWYRLAYTENNFSLNHTDFVLGGESTGLEGSLVQKYSRYGTRLEPGNYRIVLKMNASDGAMHYLAEEFTIK